MIAIVLTALKVLERGLELACSTQGQLIIADWRTLPGKFKEDMEVVRANAAKVDFDKVGDFFKKLDWFDGKP
jgi:hypothetical protein